MLGIYKITSPSGKIYIGQSVNIENRFKNYLYYKNCKKQPKIYRSLIKYGSKNHIYEILEECEESDLNNRERYWQDFYNVLGSKGLNCKLTKSDDKSGKLSEEHKRKISESEKGKFVSEETHKKISIFYMGKFRDKKIKNKISNSLLLHPSFCKKVINIITKEIYPSIREAAKIHNMSSIHLGKMLSINNKTNNTTFLRKYKDYMEFGIQKIRIKKEEKYIDKGVITFLPVEKEGAGRKMILNSKALEMMSITDMKNQVSFSFSGPDIYIVNTSGTTNTSGLKVGKTTNGFSDKKHYNFIKEKMFNLTDTDALELFFEETEQEFNDNKVFRLVENYGGGIVAEPIVESNLDKYGSPCTNHAVQQENDEDLEIASLTDYKEEYTQEELDAMNSMEYAKEIQINNLSQ